ncbi:MAG: hypothetical protein WBB34_20795 [Xanthobacteraceae bacterium]
MRNSLLKVSATLALLSAGLVFAPTANATAFVPPAPQTSTATKPALVLAAAIVCGGNGCNPVHTKAQKKRKFQTLGHG